MRENNMNENQIKNLVENTVENKIKEKLRRNFDKKIGDIPTDNLQLVPKRYVDEKIYAGFVNADGTEGDLFPVNWSVVNGSTAQYTITHSLNTTAIAIQATQFWDGVSTLCVPTLRNITANTFDIWWFALSGGNHNTAFSFTLSIR